jgi:CheY-like chemotaxis protein
MTKALIIEDNENNMKLISFILEKSGFETVKAEDGQTGLKLASEENPDFIILDIQLPDMNGMEVLAELRKTEKFKSIPVIAMTSFAGETDRKGMINGGCNGYIEKPIDPATVLDEIKQIIGSKA